MTERRDVIRTKTAICEAYIDLRFQKDRKKIKVQDVLNQANLCHGTFYSHYRNIDDLHATVNGIAVADCQKVIAQSKNAQAEPLLDSLEPRREELREMAAKRNLDSLASDMKQSISSALIESFDCANSPVPMSLCSMIANTLVDSTLDWLITDDGPDRETFLRSLNAFIDGGVNAVVRELIV